MIGTISGGSRLVCTPTPLTRSSHTMTNIANPRTIVTNHIPTSKGPSSTTIHGLRRQVVIVSLLTVQILTIRRERQIIPREIADLKAVTRTPMEQLQRLLTLSSHPSDTNWLVEDSLVYFMICPVGEMLTEESVSMAVVAVVSNIVTLLREGGSAIVTMKRHTCKKVVGLAID